jgi:hypothetical protein
MPAATDCTNRWAVDVSIPNPTSLFTVSDSDVPDCNKENAISAACISFFLCSGLSSSPVGVALSGKNLAISAFLARYLSNQLEVASTIISLIFIF